MVEVLAKIPCDSLTQDIVDSGSHANADSRELTKMARFSQ